MRAYTDVYPRDLYITYNYCHIRWLGGTEGCDEKNMVSLRGGE